VRPEERPLIAALRRGWFSLFELRRVHLDACVEVMDVLRNKRLTIVERTLTRQVGVGQVLAAWVMVDEDGTVRFEGGVLSLPLLLAPSLVEQTKSLRDDLRSRLRGMNAQERLGMLVPWLLIALQRAMAGHESRAAAPFESLPPEVQRAVAQQLLEGLMTQLDQPIPMLGGKTLRQLASRPATRPDAISWLREQERLFGQMPQPLPVDLRPLWDALGLEYQGLATDPVD